MDCKIISESKVDSNTTNFQVQLIIQDAEEEGAVEAFQLIVNKGHQVATAHQQDLIENFIYGKFNTNNQSVIGIHPTGSGTTLIHVWVQGTTGLGGY